MSVIRSVEVNWAYCTIEIVGSGVGMLHNRIPPGWVDKNRPKLSEQEQFESSLYPLDPPREAWQGKPMAYYGHPHAGFMRALVAAGGRGTSLKMTQLKAGIQGDYDADGLVPIIGTPEAFTTIARSAQGRGALISITRALTRTPWTAYLAMKYNAAMYDIGVVLALVGLAGSMVGVGCWRPETNGRFGTFAVGEGEHYVTRV